MTALPLPATPAPLRARWLVGLREDLLSTVGGLSASLLLLALHVLGGVGAAPLWWAWVLLLDGPHIFATLSRTYLDARERRERPALLRGSLGWFAAGPLAFGLSLLVGTRRPFDAFLTLAMLWAYWHVVRQHYGLLSLYQRKSGDVHPVDRRVDGLVLYVGLLAPFGAFALTHPTARRLLGLGLAPTAGEALVAQALWAAVLAAVALLAARQLQRWREGLGVNGPKLLLLGAALGLAALLFSPPVAGRVELLMVTVVVTAFHNVQYHSVVWFYHRNRYHAPGVDAAAHGLAPHVSRSFAGYAALGLAFTLLYRGLACALGSGPGCALDGGPVALGAGLTLTDLVVGLVWGVALHHYYLDQRIWRPSRDAGLQRDLKLAAG
jgi:hypothetical protein